MSDLIASLVDRALGRGPVLQRRQPTAFEPAENVLTTEIQLSSEAPVAAKNPVDTVDERAYQPGPPSAMSDNSPFTQTFERSNPIAELVDPLIAQSPREIQSPIAQIPRGPVGAFAQTVVETTHPSINEPQPTAAPRVIKEVDLPGQSLETIVEGRINASDRLHTPSEDQSRVAADQSITALKPERETNARPLAQPLAIETKLKQSRDEQSLKTHIRSKPSRNERARDFRSTAGNEANPTLGHPATPTIQVTIGRVEVRATTPARRVDSPRPAGPKLSLEDYLRGRSKGS